MPVTLKPEEQELLREELLAFAASLPEGEAPARYAEVAAAVEAGELPDETLGPIGSLLEVGLQTGHGRRLHRAAGEQALLRLFGKTPAGQALAEATADVNKALQQLEGQTIETARVLTRVPGTHLLMLSTDACEITLRFSPDGVGVESIAVGV
ncbi:MAG: hypothetical protein ACRDI2_00210 [Chloroflexota bacterium]